MTTNDATTKAALRTTFAAPKVVVDVVESPGGTVVPSTGDGLVKLKTTAS
jgi:hypothetical protein